jgi:hypothetical protein
MPAEEQKIVSDLMDSFHGQNYTVRLMFTKVNEGKSGGWRKMPWHGSNAETCSNQLMKGFFGI